MTLNNEGDAKKVPQETEELLDLVKNYVKLEAIDRLSVATTFLIVGGIIVIFGVSAVFFLSLGLAKTVALWLDSEEAAYYLLGGLLLLVIIIFYRNRKAWVETPVVRQISQSFLKETPDDEEETI